MAKHLEDIGKDAKDLLNESYLTDGTIKVSAQSRTLGFVHKLTLNRTIKREKSAKEIITATFEPKYEFKDYNLDFTGKVTSSNDMSMGTSIRDIIPRTKIEFNLNKSDRDGLSTALLTTYKSDFLAIKSKINYPFSPKQPIKLNFETVLHHRRSQAGLGVDINYEGNIAHVFTEGVLAHTTRDSQYKGLVRYDVYNGALNLGFSFWQKISERCNWALDLFSENSMKTTFTAGTEYKVDEASSVKGKWKLVKTADRIDYRIAASIKQKLSPYVTFILSSDLNPRSFIGGADGEPHSFGLEIKLQD